MTPNQIEILKIIVPAVASFLGALLAGSIAIYSAIKSLKLSHKNSLMVLRQTSFSTTISETYKEILNIITVALRENRLLNHKEINQIAPLTIWVNEEIVIILNKLLQEKEIESFNSLSSELINRIREYVGANEEIN